MGRRPKQRNYNRKRIDNTNGLDQSQMSIGENNEIIYKGEKIFDNKKNIAIISKQNSIILLEEIKKAVNTNNEKIDDDLIISPNLKYSNKLIYHNTKLIDDVMNNYSCYKESINVEITNCENNKEKNDVEIEIIDEGSSEKTIQSTSSSVSLNSNELKLIEEIKEGKKLNEFSEDSLALLDSLFHLDLLTSVIIDKIRKKAANQNNQNSGKNFTNYETKFSISSFYSLICILGTVICIVAKLYSYLPDGINSKFKFVPASQFKHSASILKGKNDVLREWSEDIIKKNNWITSNKREDLIKILDPSSLAHMLYGPPGTGKSIFVQALAYVTEILLKKEFFMKMTNKRELDVLSMYIDLEEYVEANIPSKVQFLMITPSSINDKYVGESEKNVKALFKELYNFNDPNGIRIVFFDECESFFNKRGGDRSNRTASEMSVQTEFLTCISQHQEKIKGVFLFAATNIPDAIDEAFKRRFGNKFAFDKPKTLVEIEVLIKNSLLELGDSYSSNVAKSISTLFKNTSQAYITRTVRSFIVRDKVGNPLTFDIDKCTNQLSQIKVADKV